MIRRYPDVKVQHIDRESYHKNSKLVLYKVTDEGNDDKSKLVINKYKYTRRTKIYDGLYSHHYRDPDTGNKLRFRVYDNQSVTLPDGVATTELRALRMFRASEDQTRSYSLDALRIDEDDEFEQWCVNRAEALIKRSSTLINKISRKNAERRRSK